MMALLAEQTPAIFMFGLPSLYGVARNISGFGASSDKILRLAKVEIK
jgi:peptide/nickel transport system substrate-binding protein